MKTTLASPELELLAPQSLLSVPWIRHQAPQPCREAAPVTRRWGRAAQAAAEQKGGTPADSSALHLGGGGVASMG